jgi:hydrogenase small subunit
MLKYETKGGLTRREFLRLCLGTGVTLSLGNTLSGLLWRVMAEEKSPPVIWLEANTCAGDILSVANTFHPDLFQLLMETISLHYSNLLMRPQGEQAIEVLLRTLRERRGDYILVVEGTIPVGKREYYSIIGRYHGETWTALRAAQALAAGAKTIITAGACSSWGGPYSAQPNPSGGLPLDQVINRPVIKIAGCPVHPDWVVGTITHLLLYGQPRLDSLRRPKLFFGDLVHNHCQRRSAYENGFFARYPGDEGCMWEIGCRGPVTYADCPRRLWNGEHNNFCILANTPCIGCASPGFSEGMEPFFVHLQGPRPFGAETNANRFAAYAGGAALAGVAGHGLVSAVKGRLGKGAKKENAKPKEREKEQKGSE